MVPRIAAGVFLGVGYIRGSPASQLGRPLRRLGDPRLAGCPSTRNPRDPSRNSGTTDGFYPEPYPTEALDHHCRERLAGLEASSLTGKAVTLTQPEIKSTPWNSCRTL